MEIEHTRLLTLQLHRRVRHRTNSRVRGKAFCKMIAIFLNTCALVFFAPGETAGQDTGLLVRLAKLEIDSAQLDQYKAALAEEIEASIRLESGVLTLHAVAEKENPNQITILEIYADSAAYRSHLLMPHFQKYKIGTQQMVKSLKLIETEPIFLGTKSDADKTFIRINEINKN